MKRTAIVAFVAAVVTARDDARADAAASLRALFDAKGPAHVHYRARVVDASGRAHRLEVWREDGVRVRRSTDDRVDMFVERREGGLVVTMHDRKHARTYSVDDQQLLALGRPLHWTDVAYEVKLPRGDEPVTRGNAVRARGAGARTCQPFTVGAGRDRFTFCWSDALKLPVVVKNGRGEIVFELQEASTGAPAPGSYDPPAVDVPSAD